MSITSGRFGGVRVRIGQWRVKSLAVLAFWAVGAQGATFWWNSGFSDGGLIPDNSSSGWQDVQSVSMPGASQITDVDVLIDIGGATFFDGWNGDLYARLSHSSGVSILFNRVGRTTTSPNGYGESGFGPTLAGVRFRLDDAAATDVHYYRPAGYSVNNALQLTGTWQPDARDEDPTLVDETSTRDMAVSLAAFNNLDPNGDWTLFVSDRLSGDAHMVKGWGLEIVAVPEPGVSALLAGCGLLAFAVVRRGLRRRLPGRSC